MKVIELEKVSLSEMENLKTVKTLTADKKYSLLRRDNSMQTIQMHLSQKQTNFSHFFVHFTKLN